MTNEEVLGLQTEIFGSIFFLTHHLARRADVAMESLDVTTKQWLLLVVLLKKFPDRCPTLSEAARWYGSSRQNVKQIAQQLEDRGYLRLVSDPTDRRALRLQLTEKIERFNEPAETNRQIALMKDLFSSLDGPDLELLRDLIRRWFNAVAPK